MNILPSWFGASAKVGLYMQFRVMQFREGTHYPLGTFWTDRELSKIDPANVYFFAPGLRRFKKSIVQGSFVVWLDFDGVQELPIMHLPPSLVVATGGGFQVYWKADEFMFPERLQLVIDRVLSLYGTADILVKDVTRFLRWPGTFNHKYNPPRKAEIVEVNDYVYSCRQIMAL